MYEVDDTTGAMARVWRRIKARQATSSLALLLTSPYFIPKTLLRDALTRELGHPIGGLVLDVGCGHQPYRHLFEKTRYVGIDIDRQRAPEVVATAEKIAVAGEVADLVLCTEVIEHNRVPQAVAAELSRILRRGGVLILSAPMSWNLHYEPHDYFRFTPYVLTYLLELAGFEVNSVHRIGGLISLIGARLADIVYLALQRSRLLRHLRGRMAIATLCAVPFSLAFYLLGKVIDPIDYSDAIGWLVKATKNVGVEERSSDG